MPAKKPKSKKPMSTMAGELYKSFTDGIANFQKSYKLSSDKKKSSGDERFGYLFIVGRWDRKKAEKDLPDLNVGYSAINIDPTILARTLNEVATKTIQEDILDLMAIQIMQNGDEEVVNKLISRLAYLQQQQQGGQPLPGEEAEDEE